MNKLVLILSLVALPLAKLIAQPGQEKLENLKIAFITQQLDLSTDEAQKFWPVYNQYTAESRKTRQDYQGKDQLEMQQKLLDVKKKYKPDFLKAISSDKFEKFLTLEDQWRDKLKKELDRRRDQRRNGSAPGE